jgi:hypothetical protein
MHTASILLVVMAAAQAAAVVIVDWRDCNDRIIRKYYPDGVYSTDVPSCQRAVRIPEPGNDQCNFNDNKPVGGMVLRNSNQYTDLRNLPFFFGVRCN